VTAIDVGARLIAFDDDGTVTRIEKAGASFAKEAGLSISLGTKVDQEGIDAMASKMADRLMEVVALQQMTTEGKALLRLPPLAHRGTVNTMVFSGGVSEFVYGHEARVFGDLGPALAKEMKARVADLDRMLMVPEAGIRATVIGASQYTIQVSGSTIYISPTDIVPIRNIPVVTPEFDLQGEVLDEEVIAQVTNTALTRLDLGNADTPVAVGFRWGGSATFWRLDGFCKGLVQALKPIIDKGHPLVLVSDGDIGGLLGLHLREEVKLSSPVISIDGIDLREFDYIDVGALIPSSGAVPVVIKSLIFPGSSGQ
jgi:ethanolamine utilization protein EutA